MRQGEIYLANFGKKYNSEFGKVRPAVILQNNIANRNIDKVDFKGVTVAPLTTSLYESSVRVRIEARDSLDKSSDICINELCTLDISRLELTNMLTRLTEEELFTTKEYLKAHLSI